jgi:hypothetical protein
MEKRQALILYFLYIIIRSMLDVVEERQSNIA